ncbi:MAG: TlpA family protein disulfide reductase [Gemmatimonadetes bacterium]|nr:TlpA family protein disulfide reductase [Gemmatimonadota bacterium]
MEAAPSPADRLRAATAAIQGLESATYDYTYRGTGSLAGSYAGLVRLAPGAGGGTNYWAQIRPSPWWEADDSTPPTEAPALTLSAGGDRVAARDGATRTFRHGTISGGAGHLVANAGIAVLYQLMDPEPFRSELEGETAFGERRSVNGVLCDVIEGTNASFGGARIEWFIAVEDDLPRGYRFVAADGGAFTFEMANFQPNRAIPPQSLAISSQPDDVVSDEDARPIEVGAEAPDWRLTDTDGDEIRLSALRGRIVVLEVGASWCGACGALSAEYDRVARSALGGPSVRFLALRAWENPDLSPAETARLADTGYPVIPGGERIAMDYKLADVPALFVIDAGGRFALVHNPVSVPPADAARDLEDALRTLVVDR